VAGTEGIRVNEEEHLFHVVGSDIVIQEEDDSSIDGATGEVFAGIIKTVEADFKGIFEAMVNPETGEGYPVVIRLIDPPLHEFLPSYEDLLVEVPRLEMSGNNPQELKEKRELLEAVGAMREMNPMLGLRGCRLRLLYPEINVMQTRAILEAAQELAKQGMKLQPKIMIPLVGHVNELKEVRRQLEAVAKEITTEAGSSIDYKFGTMIELPRAALTADQIATMAEFFSFGTNDLTQTTFGISRDDAEGKFLLKYVDGLEEPGAKERVKILAVNPFQTLDRDGVGQLVRMAVEKGRKANPHLELGICGEHGGDPDSIEFCNEVGLDYVSCSPFRVPVARLATAQAALKGEEKDK
jgi:pyruvate, orthophosphate dikinase